MYLGRASCLGADGARVTSLEIGREEMQLWREIEDHGMESPNNRSHSLFCIYFVLYTQAHFSIKITDWFHGKLYHETLLMVIPYTNLPYTTELPEVIPKVDALYLPLICLLGTHRSSALHANTVHSLAWLYRIFQMSMSLEPIILPSLSLMHHYTIILWVCFPSQVASWVEPGSALFFSLLYGERPPESLPRGQPARNKWLSGCQFLNRTKLLNQTWLSSRSGEMQKTFDLNQKLVLFYTCFFASFPSEINSR